MFEGSVILIYIEMYIINVIAMYYWIYQSIYSLYSIYNYTKLM